MKPFDLDAAKRGEPIQTRDGRAAKFITYVPEAREDSRVIALVAPNVGLYSEDGLMYADINNGADLFMAPKKRTVWVNLYSFGDGHAKHYETEEDASEAAQRTFAKRIGNRAWPLEIEE